MAEVVVATIDITCEQCRDLLSEYVDREILEADRRIIEKHLYTCTKCVTESSRLQGLKNIVGHWDGVKSSGEFRKSVMQRMIRESQQVPSGQFNEAAASSKSLSAGLDADEEPREPKSLPPIWVLAAAAVLAFIAYYVILKIRGL